MNEGLMVIDQKGRVLLANDKALGMLDKTSEELEGHSFAAVFFEEKRNDKFNQTILDAIYKPEQPHTNVVSFYVKDDDIRFLQIVTSGLTDEGKVTGIIVLISDITELVEVRAHLKLMREIEALNEELKKRSEFIRDAFSRYLSDEIVEKILDTPDGISIGGSLSNITILMSDLRGFTAMCEQMEPDSLIRMLNNYLDHMGRIIKELRGTVIEYVGDGILAIFGDPVKSENHASDAVRAAILMQKEMQEINAWNEEHGYPRLGMGIGINSGDAVVGNVGSEFAVRFNVIGSSVNLCGRIESYTTGGQVFISAATKEMLDAEPVVEETMEVTPKGVSEPVTLYSVKGLGAPYDISYEVFKAPMVTLVEEVPAKLWKLDGKHVSGESIDIRITAKSTERLSFISDAGLNELDNVVLKEHSKEIYGKIENREGDDYTMVITGHGRRESESV